MKKLNIALLAGGRSTEREVSISSGRQVEQALDKTRYNVTCYDPATDLARIVADAPGIDFALNILHGPSGEDGSLQGLLDLLDIPYQGSGVLGSAVSMNKLLSKQLYAHHRIPTPPYLACHHKSRFDARTCVQNLGLPLIVKPAEAGSSVGMAKVSHTETLEIAVAEAFQFDDLVLVEKFIPGRELTVGVLGNHHLTTLPVVEIIPDKGYDFFSYAAKYTMGEAREICPADIRPDLDRQARDYAKQAHEILFCCGYSRTDMILTDDNILYTLETNTIPGMTETSLLPLAAKTDGMGFSQLLDRLITLGMEAYSRKKKLKK